MVVLRSHCSRISVGWFVPSLASSRTVSVLLSRIVGFLLYTELSTSSYASVLDDHHARCLPLLLQNHHEFVCLKKRDRLTVSSYFGRRFH